MGSQDRGVREVRGIQSDREMTGGIKIVSEQNLGSYVTLHPTNTTNTFTPTTLKTIEQMFVDVNEQPETYKNPAGFAPPTLKHKTYINMDSSNWQQGGVTTGWVGRRTRMWWQRRSDRRQK